MCGSVWTAKQRISSGNSFERCQLTLIHLVTPKPDRRLVLGEAPLHEGNVVVVKAMIPIVAADGTTEGLHQLPRQSLPGSGKAHDESREYIARDGFTGLPLARRPIPSAEGTIAGIVAIRGRVAKFRADLVQARSKTEGRHRLTEDLGLLERGALGAVGGGVDGLFDRHGQIAHHIAGRGRGKHTAFRLGDGEVSAAHHADGQQPCGSLLPLEEGGTNIVFIVVRERILIDAGASHR